MLKFANPHYLALFLPLIAIFFFKRKKKGITVPSVEGMGFKEKKTKKHLIGKLLSLLSLSLMIVALARPQKISQNVEIKKEGIDIVISLDLSQSMLQRDFKPNRIEKAKELLLEFIAKRQNDRLGLVIFGGEAYTKVPLTFDHNVLHETLSVTGVESITSNTRTAIGMGLGVAINRLKDSKSKSKVIILLTDGENNSGEMNPVAAAQIAKELGIKVYTIGIGAREISVPTLFGTRKVQNTELDEGLLEYIAKETSGKYFRASDNNEFKKIFVEIDKLEKTEIDSRDVYDKQELFEPILKLAVLMLLIGCLFEYLLFIKIP